MVVVIVDVFFFSKCSLLNRSTRNSGSSYCSVKGVVVVIIMLIAVGRLGFEVVVVVVVVVIIPAVHVVTVRIYS